MESKIDLKVVLEKHKKWINSEKDGECANLWGANLWGANLRGADLRGADLDVKVPPLTDHYFISEILYRESKTIKEKSWAGLVRISINWCWEDFFKECSKPMINWAKKILCSKWPEFEEKFK